MSAAGQRISNGVGALLAVSVSIALGLGVFASIARQNEGWFPAARKSAWRAQR